MGTGFQSVRSPDDTLTGAEYASQGFSHLCVRCSECTRVTQIPWGIFKGPLNVPLKDLAPKLKCRCGKKLATVHAYAMGAHYLKAGVAYVDG